MDPDSAPAMSNRIKIEELDESEEWTLFDDPSIISIAGNWMGVLEYCLERGYYPISIFYEKLEEGLASDGNATYAKRAGFDFGRDLL